MFAPNKFALLVPCYNAANYIDSFIENINALDQAFDEILFYDDASTDNTYELLILKGYKVIKGTENKGPGYARNKLVAHCSSNWVHFHDIDDGLKPNYLLKVAAVIEERKNVDVILCNVNWYHAETMDLLLSWNYSDAQINQNPLRYTLAKPIGGINGLYRKSKVVEVNGFSTHIRVWEDADFHVKLASSNAVFHVIEEVLSYALRYENSASTDQSAAWVTRLQLLNEYSERYSDKEVKLEIGIQAQVAASALIINNKIDHAKKALKLSEDCGVAVPYNNAKTWKLLKLLLPKAIRIDLRLLQLRLAFKK